MKKLLAITAFLLAAAPLSAQGELKPDYEEPKIPSYTLPELLRSSDGREITTAREWEKSRRPELLEIFSEQMFGNTPKQKLKVKYTIVEESGDALGGKARRKQVKFTFGNGTLEHEMMVLMYYPANASGPVPAFLVCGYANEGISDDEAVIPSVSTAKRALKNGTQVNRGGSKSRWPLEEIISNGFALITMANGDLYADRAEGPSKEESIARLFKDFAETKDSPDSWKAIGAWAWGYSRVMDYLETDKCIDAAKVAIMGHSRLGKTALWAGAQDRRFALVWANESGCGGDKISRRIHGETLASINANFPHWFCNNFKAYSNNENSLPFDQHMLVALIAPRPVYLGSAEGDQWADPQGQLLGGYHAGPAYELYGKKGLGTDVLPPLHTPIMNDVGFHIRAGIHDVTDYDWRTVLTFTKKHFFK